MTRTRFFTAILFFSLATLTFDSRSAEAQSSTAQVAEARRLFTRGLALSDEGRWVEALDHFERARALSPRPSVVYNVGLALLRVGRYRESVATFDEFARIADRRANAAEIERARAFQAEARRNIAQLSIMLEPPNATLRVDERVIEGFGARRVIAIDRGVRSIAVEADGYRDYREQIDARPGETVTRTVTLDSVASRETTVIVREPMHGAPPPATRDDGGVLESPVFWIVGGAVLLGAGVGIAIASSGGDRVVDPLADYMGTTGVVIGGQQ